jgi:hypothetical protein
MGSVEEEAQEATAAGRSSGHTAMSEEAGKAKKNRKPGWADIKKHISGFQREGLVDLIRDLYDASKDNRTFLHTRFSAGEDVLAPYKKLLARWLWPDVCVTNQNVSVATALKAISDYKKATGDPEGLLELKVFYCAQAAGFTREVGMDGDGWFNSLLNVFEDAVKLATSVPEDRQAVYLARLDRVHQISQNFGWGVGDQMNDIWAECGPDGNAQ